MSFSSSKMFSSSVVVVVCLVAFVCIAFVSGKDEAGNVGCLDDNNSNRNKNKNNEAEAFCEKNHLKTIARDRECKPFIVATDQCDQIGRFFKVLDDTYSFKSGPNVWQLLGLFRKRHF